MFASVQTQSRGIEILKYARFWRDSAIATEATIQNAHAGNATRASSSGLRRRRAYADLSRILSSIS